jgi:tetratricopeptide (TPR) repeat protein
MGNEDMSASQFLKQANQLKRAGRLDEAIALYHQAIEINPHFAWTYYNLADALVQQNYLDDAIDCLNQAIKINSATACFHYQLSEVLALQGRFNRALAYFDRFLKLNLNNQVKFDENGFSTEKIYENKITRSSLWAGLKYANILAHNNQIEAAINLYQKIIEDSRYQYSEIYNKLGELFFRTGERKKAVTNFEIAIFLNPDVAQYHLNLAEALDRWSLSVKSYQAAVKLNPMVLKNYYDRLEFVNALDIKVKNPIFVVGCGHSGTSVMLALLGSHPCLYPIPYESSIFLQSLNKIEERM